jgi:hypothetical protein
MRDEYEFRITKTRLRTIIGVVAAFALLVPTAAWASHTFTDVPDDNTFHEDIEAIQAAGVTVGCNPPENTEYCPEDLVTREQMAAFMNRLGALGEGQEPVANAAELNGFPAENYVFAPESVSLLERSVDFELEGGASEECAETSSLTFEPDFSAIHQLHATPDGIDPWDINVQLDTRGMSEGVYSVCFATLDGVTPLPAGTYETFGVMTLP